MSSCFRRDTAACDIGVRVSDVTLQGSNAAAALDNLYRAVGALRQNLDFLDARVTLLEIQLPKIRSKSWKSVVL